MTSAPGHILTHSTLAIDSFVVANLIPKIIVQSFDIVLAQADYHDGLVQGAEIEALYENTRQLLNASAAIYDEVVCRCVPDFQDRKRRKLRSSMM